MSDSNRPSHYQVVVRNQAGHKIKTMEPYSRRGALLAAKQLEDQGYKTKVEKMK